VADQEVLPVADRFAATLFFVMLLTGAAARSRQSTQVDQGGATVRSTHAVSLISMLALALYACGDTSSGGGSDAPLGDVADTAQGDVDTADVATGSTTYLLLGTGFAEIEVLRADDGADPLTFAGVLALPESDLTTDCGFTVGPDRRLYVTDQHGLAVHVFDLAQAVAGGSPSPVARLEYPEPSAPCGAAFDANGTLWLADGRSLLGFRDAASLGGTETRTPDVVLSPDPAAFGMISVTALHVDGAGNLWGLRQLGGLVRFDGAAALADGTYDHPPELIVHSGSSTTAGAPDDTMFFPGDFAFDESGRVYVANLGDPGYISRFDGLAELTGELTPEPDAYLILPHAGGATVAIDADGAVWAARDDRVVRLASATGDGVVEVTSTADVPLDGEPRSRQRMTFIVGP